MFSQKTWAAAFMKSLENDEKGIDEGIETFSVLASWVISQKDMIFGREAAEKMEPVIRKGISTSRKISPAQETAIRFFLLIVRKNKIRHITHIQEEISNQYNRKKGIVSVSAEYAFEPKAEFKSKLIKAVKNRYGAAAVIVSEKLNPDLIGGYRLRIGDEIIDASVRSQLQEMKTCLASIPLTSQGAGGGM